MPLGISKKIWKEWNRMEHISSQDLLVYVDDVNILGEHTNNMKKDTISARC